VAQWMATFCFLPVPDFNYIQYTIEIYQNQVAEDADAFLIAWQ